MLGRIERELKVNKSIERNLQALPDYITFWHSNLQASKKTASSRRDYVNKVRNFLEYINPVAKDVNLTEITQANVTNYMISIQTKKTKDGDVVYTSDSYQQTVWCCLNNFFSFLKSNGMIEVNYMDNIAKTSNKDLNRINQNRILLTKEDFKKIIEAVDHGAGSSKAKARQSSYRNRDKAIVMLFMQTGMRRQALSEINIDDIDVYTNQLTVIDKGGKIHVYPLTDNTVECIKAWLNEREKIKSDSDALFLSCSGTRMSGNALYELIDKYSQEGLGYHISPHKLRSGYCSILYEETHDVEFVRRSVGHSNVATTQRYIVTGNKERVKAANIIDGIF